MSLREKLEAEILETNWSPVAPHFARGNVYLLDDDLDILDVAVAMAEDQVSTVKIWLDDGLLSPPTPEEATIFHKKDGEIIFNMLIIEPYVLIQKKVG